MLASPRNIGALLLAVLGSLTTAAQAQPRESESEKILREASEPLEGFNGSADTLSFSPDGHTLFGGGRGRPPAPYRGGRGGEAVYVIWRTNDWEYIRETQDLPNRWPDPDGRPINSAFLDRGKWLIVLTDDHELKLFREGNSRRNLRPKWLLQKTKSLAKVYPEATSPNGPYGGICNAPGYAPLRISPDERWLALPMFTYPISRRTNHQSAGLVDLWKIASTERTANTGPEFSHHLTIKQPKTIKQPNPIFWGMDFGADSKTLVTTANDLSIRIWNVEDGSLIKELTADDGLPKQLKADELLNDPQYRERQCSVDVSPDGKTLAIGFGRVVRLYDLQNKRWLTHHRLTGGRRHTKVVFHPSGRWLVSTNGMSKLALWSLPRLQPRLTVDLPKHAVDERNVAFSPDGKLMVTGGYEPLRWSFDKLVELAGNQAKR